MAKLQAISHLRNLLTIKSRALGRDGVSTKDVIAVCRRDHPEVIAAAREQLEDIALGKLLSQGRSKIPSSVDARQQTLFTDLGAPLQIAVNSDDGKKVHKNIEDCTFEELDDYVAALPVRQSVSPRKNGLLKVKEALLPYKNEAGNNIGKCLQVFLGNQNGKRSDSLF